MLPISLLVEDYRMHDSLQTSGPSKIKEPIFPTASSLILQISNKTFNIKSPTSPIDQSPSLQDNFREIRAKNPQKYYISVHIRRSELLRVMKLKVGGKVEQVSSHLVYKCIILLKDIVKIRVRSIFQEFSDDTNARLAFP